MTRLGLGGSVLIAWLCASCGPAAPPPKTIAPVAIAPPAPSEIPTSSSTTPPAREPAPPTESPGTTPQAPRTPPTPPVPRPGALRPTIVGSVPVALADLPTTTVPPAFARTPSAVVPARPTPIDLRSPFGVLASLGPYRGWYRGGPLTCQELDMLGTDPRAVLDGDDGGGGVEPARFEAPVVRTDGGAELIFGDGWFDASRCAATIERRTSVAMKELVPKSLYAFVSCERSCSASEDVVLVFLGARNAVSSGDSLSGGKPLDNGGFKGGFARVRLPRRGGPQSAVVDLDPHAAEGWLGKVSMSPALARQAKTAGLVVTVELGAAREPLATTAVAHVGVPASIAVLER